LYLGFVLFRVALTFIL